MQLSCKVRSYFPCNIHPLLSEYTYLHTSSVSLSIMEVLPLPLGIATLTSSGSSALVALAGQVSSLPASLLTGTAARPGMAYYATTSGTLVSGGCYYGREQGVCSSSSSLAYASSPSEWNRYYVVDEEVGVLVSISSRVGVALSSSELYLSTV